MYFLRKIHKIPHQIHPIVSCCSGPTEKISGFLGENLQAFCCDVPALLGNSTQLIRKLEDSRFHQHKVDLILATLDIKALYSNIPQEKGVDMVLDWTHPPRPYATETTHRSMLRDLLLTVIKDNIFEFGGQTYRQVKGVAMGTRMVPPFANLFMAQVEEQALSSWKVCAPPVMWTRYLDDVFLIWGHSQERLQLFLSHLNSILPTINLTMTCSTKEVDFLDITIFKGPRFDREGILDIRHLGHQALL